MPKALIVLAIALAVMSSSPVLAGQATARPCTSVTVNGPCEITIDREHAVSPLPVRMQSGATATIRVTKRPLEQIVTQETTVETPSVDALAAIFAAFLPGLKAGVALERSAASGEPGAASSAPNRRARSLTTDDGRKVQQQLEDITSAQRDANERFVVFERYTRSLGRALQQLQAEKAGKWEVARLREFRSGFVCAVRGPDVGHTGASCDTGFLPAATVLPLGTLKALDARVDAVTRAYANLQSADQRELSDAFNDVAAGQEWLSGRAKSLAAAQSALVAVAAVLDAMDPGKMTEDETFSLATGKTSGARTATVKIVAQDLVTKATTPLATVVVNWGGSRWELSTGALFSSVVERTFQVSPVIVNGVPKVDADDQPYSVITESVTRPTVIPAVLAHFRIAEVAINDGSQRLAFLASVAAGVNPYSGSADFGAGLTFAYRGFVVSPMLHGARQLKLTQGLRVGQEFVGTPPTLTTERYWVGRFAVGISYRIPLH